MPPYCTAYLNSKLYFYTAYLHTLRHIHPIHCVVSLHGSLTIVQHPLEDDEFEDNRTGIVLGSNVSMGCAATYSGRADHTPPVQILWTRDGEVVVSHANCGGGNAEVGPGESIHCISESSENLNSSLHIHLQQFGGAGVYQCSFIINDTETEFVTTRPLRIDTGTYYYQGLMDSQRRRGYVTRHLAKFKPRLNPLSMHSADHTAVVTIQTTVWFEFCDVQ